MRLRDDGPPRLNVLVAYPYFKGSMTSLLGEHQGKLRVLIDSGAFTAFKSGNPIKLDDYCKFLENIPVKPWGYFMLDVIGQPDATMKNYREMLRRGFDPIPIFTRGTDIAVLEEYFQTSDIVGIGGLVRTPKNRGFVNGIMEPVAGRAVHLLGFSDIPFLKQYRPFSCDSSGWDQASYGQFRLYMGHGQFTYVKRDMCTKPLPLPIQQRLAHYGIDAPTLSKETGWRGDKSKGDFRRDGPRDKATCRGMIDFAFDMEERIKTKYFFASNTTAIRGLAAAMEWRAKRC